MNGAEFDDAIGQLQKDYPEKFAAMEKIFKHIHRGDRIFIGTGCGEPNYLVKELVAYIDSHPKAIFDAEVFHVWTLGVAPYTDERFRHNFRHNSFFIGDNTRDAVNRGLADYTPVFLSRVPDLFQRKYIPVDVALIQTSLPDSHGYMSLGISVDIVKAAVEHASLVITQINPEMPRVHGDGFIHLKRVDFAVPHREPLLEFSPEAPDEIVRRIGNYVAKIIEDGDTLQVGYGSIPNSILSALHEKKHIGIHTELLTDGIVDLIRKGVVDNSRKTVNRGKTVASFCMGKKATYEFIHDNPTVEFRTIDYTNNPTVIARQDNMLAINSALQLDLTGQATAESIGKMFYSGIGGQADFMRGAVMARNGKTILALESTAENGTISRIVPMLSEGSGVTLNRGDIHYVVTEYGIAYLLGKNIRERAMDLIAIAHPEFRSWLIEEAKKLNLIYRDQAYFPGKRGEYPEHLETFRTTYTGIDILLRPVRISDEPLLKDFFYSLSDSSMYRRFISSRMDMPHERLQEFVVVDQLRETVILAVAEEDERDAVVGIGQYVIYDEQSHSAEVAIVIRDDYQHKGIGRELVRYLEYLAKRQGVLGFTASVLVDNKTMLGLFEHMGFDIETRNEAGMYELKMTFKE